MTEDAPLHTSIVQAYLDQRQVDAAWRVFNEMREVGVAADAISYTAMLTACAMQDQLEQARARVRGRVRVRVRVKVRVRVRVRVRARARVRVRQPSPSPSPSPSP